MQASLGAILTVTTGRFLTPDIGDLYTLLGFMVGYEVFTHEIPDACNQAALELLRQFPQLADVDASSVTEDNWRDWLDEQEAKYGKEFTVTAPESAGRTESPVASLARMRGTTDDIIVVKV